MNATTTTAVPEARRYNAGMHLAQTLADVLNIVSADVVRQRQRATQDRAILYGQLTSVPGFTDYMRRQLEQLADDGGAV